VKIMLNEFIAYRQKMTFIIKSILIKILILLVAAVFPAFAFATDNPLAEYRSLIEKANKAPLQNSVQPVNPSVSNGQAALTPTAPAPAVMPGIPAAPPAALSPLSPNAALQQSTQSGAQSQQQSTETNSNKPSSTNAGPPNIFITPGGNSNNNQNNSIIHY